MVYVDINAAVTTELNGSGHQALLVKPSMIYRPVNVVCISRLDLVHATSGYCPVRLFS